MEYNYKTLELKIISATDLQKPTLFSPRTHPYVVVSLSSVSHSTPVSPDGGRNPTWNHAITFPLPPASAAPNSLLHFQVRRRSALAATPSKLIGEVRVPLLDLLSNQPAVSSPPGTFVSYQILTPAGRSKGVLTFSFRFTGPLDPLHASNPAEPYTKLQSYPPPSVNSHSPAVYPPIESPVELYPPPPKENNFNSPPGLPSKLSPYPPCGDLYPPSPATSLGTQSHPPSSHPFNSVYPPPPHEGNVGFGYYPGQVASGYPAPMGYGYPVQPAYQYGYGYRG